MVLLCIWSADVHPQYHLVELFSGAGKVGEVWRPILKNFILIFACTFLCMCCIYSISVLLIFKVWHPKIWQILGCQTNRKIANLCTSCQGERAQCGPIRLGLQPARDELLIQWWICVCNLVFAVCSKDESKHNLKTRCLHCPGLPSSWWLLWFPSASWFLAQTAAAGLSFHGAPHGGQLSILVVERVLLGSREQTWWYPGDWVAN